ncbi:site-specific tyrosine recombinase XerC [Posidoniimonas corsicana]|uniref:Site-specific tyrosine recombinase XerC n=1 Tax=Posidoniimonas corsicana TaxID=1938618 RepID=A0A5C5UUC3_9BACT|nr:site-specific integrase [Posidoniimonas corsicana]TWT29183.1 site-specific tyrosine recombinase XerC [Posidoniimonas corsicana]
MEEIKVHVVDKGRKYLYMLYRDPITNRQVARSTGTASKKEAAKVAAKWEAELQEGRYERSARMPWAEFREAWEDAHMHDLAPATMVNYAATFNAFEDFCNPQRVGDLTTPRVTAYAAHLRRERTRTIKRGGEEVQESYRLSEASVGRHLRHLKAVARWASRQGMLPKVPQFEMPKRANAARMKGRPITGEEFDRMIAAVPKVVGENAAESWKFLLRGLWTSGLRLGEALALRWDQTPGGVSVRLDGQQSVLAFDAGSQKSGKVELVPLAPEAMLLIEGRAEPSGYVFSPKRMRGEGPMVRDAVKVSKVVGKIGRKAGIITDTEKGKTATAHDLRRSFGFRWSRRIMPAELKELMRHASIETTMTYYVGHDARATSAALWGKLVDTLVDTSPEEAQVDGQEPSKPRVK